MPLPKAAILKYADIKNHPGPLFNMLKGIAIGEARRALDFGLAEKPIAADITDSSTGTSDGTVKAVAIPALFTSGGAGTCAPKAGFDTALGKLDDAFESLGTEINKARRKLGLTLLTLNGTAATPGTIAALDKTLTGVDGGTLCVNGTDARARITSARNNLATLALALNDVMVYCGRAPITDNSGGTASASYVIEDLAATGAGNDGTANQTIADSTMDTALTAIADGIAGLAAKLNAAGNSDVMIRASLTDSSTGTAATDCVAVAIPDAFTHVTGSDVADKSSVDTAIAAIWDGQKAIAEHVNMIRRVLSLTPVSYTGNPATFGTVPAQTKTVTGTSGSGSVDRVTAAEALKLVKANHATLCRAVCEVLSATGALVVPVDGSGGDANVGLIDKSLSLTTLVATGTAVDGLSANSMSKAQMDAALTANANNLATLASYLNTCTGKTVTGEQVARAVYVG